MRITMRMKTKLGIAASLLLAGSIHAAVVDYNWSGVFVNGTEVPDNNANGWVDSRTLSGLNGTVSGLAVTLDLTGGWNGDLYAYVQYGSGFTVLLNRVGVAEAPPSGNAGEGFQVTFSADGTPGLHTYLAAILIMDEMGKPGEGTRPTRWRFCGGCRPGALTRRGVTEL